MANTTKTYDASDDRSLHSLYRMALSQPELTTQQAGLISVITGAMTGSFAIWMGAEKPSEPKRMEREER